MSYLSFTDIKPESKVVEPEPKEWVMDESLVIYLEEFERDFEVGLNEKQIPGAAVAIVKDGRVVLQKGFGVKERGTSEEVDEHTVFRLGSVSKGFASVLTGLMVEEGAVSWDGPVSHYLPEFKSNDPGQTDRVQIRHLLSHTSGLPRHAYTNLVENGLSLDRIIPRLEQVPLISKEGEQLAYQNAAYSTIEKVLEAQTNTDFNTLLEEKLLDPLAMDHSSASYDSIRYSGNTALPHVYHSRSRGRVPMPISEKYYNAVSSGGINASASDMGKWLLLLTGHYPDVISEKTLEEIYDPFVTIHNRRYSRHWDGVNESHYGMGWRVLDNHGQKIVYHGGYVNGYRSEIAFAPEEGVGICILINTHSSYPLTVIPDFFNHFKSNSSEFISK
ncbi:beta-lactamase family protein [Aliifodinibius sp. S!AR15-10]|uniref:serine hydrolase domain-containing protein n=1 Tax=Aliifodinibius sp. S!AR15-10 TaxID=2950437 RepID=UPI002865A8E1|nr:serine hydrolase domain-containing protein [Aliifodinibius sp. S!AR15-10]MDR8391639.1 beta-lactamase family protein [Aliifodinibius sp. S!AR15-10]